MSNISRGAVRTIFMMEEKTKPDPSFQPKLQVINIKQVGSEDNRRYRTILSDGEYYMQGMLATQLNYLVETEELKALSMIQAHDFLTNLIQNRTVVVLLRVTVMAYPGERIGDATDIEKAGLVKPVAAQPQQQPLYNSTNATGGGSNPYGGGGGGGGGANPYGAGANPYGGGGGSSQNPYGGGGASNPYGAATVTPTRNKSSYGQQQQAAPIVRSTATGTAITPINNLNMYNNRWTIQARVTSKSDIRTWSNAKGEGSLFSIELLDSSGMDIRATFFKEAVDKFYNFLEVGKVYSLSGGRLKVANMQYNTCKSNFEVTFDQNSEIHLDNDVGDISRQNYEFCKIADLESIEEKKNVDVIAIVKQVGDSVNLISKRTGNELTKCDLTLVDDSGTEVTLTVWGDKAKRAPTDFAGTPVAAFRHARVSDYGGKSLSGGDSVEVNPDIPEAKNLLAWWQSAGASQSARSLSSSMGGGAGKMDSLSERKDIAAIKVENMGLTHADKPDWLSFKAVITFLKKDKEGGAWYPACANAGEPCKNRFKVTQTTDGQWYCDKCQGTYQNCVRRWIFSGVVEDESGSTWVSFFNEQAETLLGGITAEDAHNKTFAEGHDQDAYDSYFARALFTEWVFKCKVKNEIVNDESRVKTSVYSLHPIDYVKESKDLLAAIEKF